jgi:hypothetical protein
MADVKISGLPASTVPLAGTEVLPIVQGGSTKQVSVANLTAGRSVAALSVITPTIQAEAGSAGGTIKNGSGVAQMQWGSGGGSNLSLEVATNINPANAAVNISPTGTGAVAISPGSTVTISPTGALTINPTAASTINNTSIGATTASTGRFTSVTATTGNVVIGTSGQGIDFSATPGTGTSELLNDYEEGTWTGTLTAETTAPTTPITSTGYYTKIGRQVTVSIQFINVDTTGASGVLNVTGLPFQSASVGISVGNLMTFGLSSPNAYSTTLIAGSATVIKQYTITDNGAWATVSITAGATKFLYLTNTYFA